MSLTVRDTSFEASWRLRDAAPSWRAGKTSHPGSHQATSARVGSRAGAQVARSPRWAPGHTPAYPSEERPAKRGRPSLLPGSSGTYPRRRTLPTRVQHGRARARDCTERCRRTSLRVGHRGGGGGQDRRHGHSTGTAGRRRAAQRLRHPRGAGRDSPCLALARRPQQQATAIGPPVSAWRSLAAEGAARRPGRRRWRRRCRDREQCLGCWPVCAAGRRVPAGPLQVGLAEGVGAGAGRGGMADTRATRIAHYQLTSGGTIPRPRLSANPKPWLPWMP